MLSFPYAEKIDLISFALRVQESYSRLELELVMLVKYSIEIGYMMLMP